MIVNDASITFEQKGKQVKMHLKEVKSYADLKTYAYALAAYTNAKIVEISFSQSETITDLPESSGEIQGLNLYAFLLLHGQDTFSKRLPVPSPKKDLFEKVGGKLRVTKAKGNEIAALYSTLAHEEFTFIRGRLL